MYDIDKLTSDNTYFSILDTHNFFLLLLLLKQLLRNTLRSTVFSFSFFYTLRV